MTLREILRGRGNEYETLDRRYREIAGEGLTGDPLAPRTGAPKVGVTVGVLIAVRDGAFQLAATLAALERASLALGSPDGLHVVVADDGSEEETREILAGWRPPFRFTCVRQEKAGRVVALNTGLAFLEEEVTVVCEPGVCPSPHALEELARRHQALDPLLLLGFAGHPAALPNDRRLHWAGAGDNLFVHTRHLRDLGEGRSLLSCEDGMVVLPSLAGGGIYSLRRADLLAAGGFPEALRSPADAALLVAARGLARGMFLVPVYTASCGLAEPPAPRPRPAPWALSLFGAAALLDQEAGGGELDLAACRRRAREVVPAAPGEAAPSEAEDAGDPLWRAGILEILGRYAEAGEVYAGIEGEEAALGRARTLRETGDPEASLAALAGRREPSPAVHYERGLSLARAGDFAAAGEAFTAARALDAPDGFVARVLALPPERHRQRGEHHLRQGLDQLALRDLEIGLAGEPGRTAARVARAGVLRRGGRPDLAVEGLLGPEGDTWVHLELGSAYAEMGDRNRAKLHLEASRRLAPGNSDTERRLADLHDPGGELQGTLDPQPLLDASSHVEGWFSREETLLMIALVEKAAPLAGALVEIGNYCGRSTVAIAGALRALDQPPGRLVAIDPHEGFAAGKHRDTLPVLTANLRREELEPWVRVIRARSQDVVWEGDIALLFIDGDHEYEGVAADYRNYAGHVVPGGYLLFHDYSRFEPGVRRLVDEVLDAGGPFTFLAQAGSLCALRRNQSP